jgi:hypothetical protein
MGGRRTVLVLTGPYDTGAASPPETGKAGLESGRSDDSVDG